MYRPRHFKIQELVCPHVYDVHGERAWSFFDERLLMTMDFLRDKWNTPIYVNNYDMLPESRQSIGLPVFDERGCRCILCDLVKKAIREGRLYCSAHMRFQACDFNAKGMTSGKVSLWLVSNYILLPFPIRVEKNTSGWTHIDVSNTGSQKVELFNP